MRKETNVPHHYHSATNDRRCALCGVDGYRSRLGTDTEPENETSNEEMLPGIGYTLPDTSDEREEGGDEDRSTAAKHTIQWCSQPTTDQTTAQLRNRSAHKSAKNTQ